MKNRVWLVLPVLLAFLLSGCSCTHEWTQADCLNPQTCTKCEEIGEPALGHDWFAATCDQPETCTRCGEIQGTPLGHSFGEWTLGETDMTHSCIRCGLAETAELDRGLQLETLLPGLWEFYGLYQGENFYSAYSFNVPGDFFTFGSGRTITGMLDQEPFSSTWEFLEYLEEEDERLYFFKATDNGGRTLQMMYKADSEDDALYCFFANNVQTILSRNDDTAAAVAGTWGATGKGTMYSLTFHEDRTVTGNLGEAFEGTWQLLPIRDTGHPYLNDSRMCGMYIKYLSDGEEKVLMATVSPPAVYGDNPVPEEFTAGTITVTLDGTQFVFEAMTQEEIDMQAKAMVEGPNMLVGTWSSMYYRSFNTNPATDKLALDYTVTFLSDGTFTASAGKDFSGTWVYNESRGDKTNGSHEYYLYIQGDRFPCNMVLEYTESHVPQLSIRSRSTVQGDGRILYLNKRSSQQDRMARALAGTWTSIYEDIRTTDSDRINTMAYSLTFNEDGTFTGYDGTDLKGTWIYERTRSETVYQYNLFLNGQTQEYASITMYDHSEDGDETTIDYRTRSAETGIRYISFIKYTPEDLEIAKLGPTYILGEWTSDTDGYSITICEDGTFTANLTTKIQGTWSFRRYEPDSTYCYDFAFPGQFEYGDRTMYAHIDENRLTFRIYHTEDDDEFYSMQRGN